MVRMVSPQFSGLAPPALNEQPEPWPGFAAPPGTLPALLQALPTAAAVFDRSLRYVHVNPSWVSLCSETASDCLGQRLHDRAPELASALDALLALHAGAYRPQGWRLVLPEPVQRLRQNQARGEHGPASMAVSADFHPIVDAQGELSGLLALATIVDVTQRKADRALLESALAEKTALLQEVHHRVKNNLQVISSLLSLQARSVSGPARAVLDESQGRVKAMALIHQLLYERNDFSAVALAPYLRRLCALLRDSQGPGRVRLELEIEAEANDLRLDLDRAVPCGLLVNELVSNALKHAFPGTLQGRVKIGLKQLDAQRCLLSVADDGVGLPPDVRPGQTQTLGFQLVLLLVNQLGAELQLTQAGGTHFDITLNLDRKGTP
jgi:two-component sensor histidine kinase